MGLIDKLINDEEGLNLSDFRGSEKEKDRKPKDETATSILGPFYINHPSDEQFIERNGINMVQLETGQVGVYYRWGKAVKCLEPGRPYFLFGLGKAYGSLSIFETRKKIMDLERISMKTKDNFQITIDATLNYRIADPLKLVE